MAGDAHLQDPLAVLGADVFHSVLLELPAASLLVVDQVSKSWRAWIHNNDLLWRKACRRERVDLVDYAGWRSQKPRTGGDDVGSAAELQDAYRYHNVVEKAWAAGDVRESTVLSTAPYVVKIVVADESEETMICMTRRDEFLIYNRYSGELLQRMKGLPPDGYMVVAAGYLVATCSEQDEKPPSARGEIDCLGSVEIWRTARATARDTPAAPLSDSKKPYSLVGTIDYLANCQASEIFLDQAKSDRPKAVLCAVEHTLIHLVHLEDGMKHETIEVASLDMPRVPNPEERRFRFPSSVALDDDYIYVIAGYSCTIISRKTKEFIVSFPDAMRSPASAAIAYGDRIKGTTVSGRSAPSKVDKIQIPLYAAGQNGYLSVMRRNQAPTPESQFATGVRHCVFTSRDMVFVGLRGIVYIVRNYAEVLREVTKLEPLEREAYMADHTFALTHLESVVEELAVCADRVAVFCNDDGILLLDTNNLPTLPFQPATLDVAEAHPNQSVGRVPAYFFHSKAMSQPLLAVDSSAMYFGYWPRPEVSSGRIRSLKIDRNVRTKTRPQGGVRVWSFRP